MPTNILMPALSPTMEKGNLARWLKKEGDKIKSGDVIAEIETDKATMEYEAVDDGTLAKIVVPEGTQDVAVNSVIAVLAGEGEDVKAAAGAARSAPQAAPQSRAAGSRKAAYWHQSLLPKNPLPPWRKARPRPLQRRRPRSYRGAKTVFSLHRSRGASPKKPILISTACRAPAHTVVSLRVTSIRPNPARVCAHRLARLQGPPTIAPAMSDAQIRSLYEEGSYELVPHDGMRRTIAQRLTASVQTIPHFYETMDCDIGRLMAAREEINAAAPKNKDGKPAYKLSVNDFVIKALALALQRIPDANVSWTEAGMLKHKHSDIGVAVALPGGLITPIVRNAESKSLSTISNEMRDLAVRARERKLKPHEYQGGTSSVSNLGMYGIKDFTAVINPPQSTILAVGAGEERAVVRNGKIEAATIMSVTLSCDHRAVDGALGAELIGAFKMLIENPVMMVV